MYFYWDKNLKKRWKKSFMTAWTLIRMICWHLNCNNSSLSLLLTSSMATMGIITWSLNILSYQLHHHFPLKCDRPAPCSNPETRTVELDHTNCIPVYCRHITSGTLYFQTWLPQNITQHNEYTESLLVGLIPHFFL